MAKIFLSINRHELAAEADALRALLAREHALVLSDRSNNPDFSFPLADRRRALIGECDVFIGVYGAKSQPLPHDSESSFEEVDFNTSSDLAKPRLIYVRDAEQTDGRMSRFRQSIVIRVPYRAYSDVLGLVYRIRMDLAEALNSHGEASDVELPELSLIQVILKPRIPIPEYYPEYLKILIKSIRLFQNLPVALALFALVLAVLIYFLHSNIEQLRDEIGGRIVVFFGGDPPEIKEAPLVFQKDAEKIGSLQSDAWQKGRAWKPASNDTIVTGSDPGILPIGTTFSALYGFIEYFTVTIPRPDDQRSIAWIVRMESRAQGDSYYLITVMLPPVRDTCPKDGSLSNGMLKGEIVHKGSDPQKFDEVPIENWCMVKGVPRALSIQTIASGARFQVAISMTPDEKAPSGERGELPYISRPLVDSSSTLKWGDIGFIGPEKGHGAETIGGLMLFPALGKSQSSNGSK